MSARILVVDDIPANVKLLEARLSAEYFDVMTASNGTQALEIALLPLDLLGRVGAAEPLSFGSRQFLSVLLFDLYFDRHAVAIPSRNIWRIESGHRFALDDDVLEDLVDCVSDVDVTVRVRRPVVQHEPRTTTTCLPNALIEFALLPAFQHRGFPPREIGAHREGRIG